MGGGDGICLLRVSEAEEHHYGLNTTKTKPRLSGAPQSAPPSGEGDGTGGDGTGGCPVRQREAAFRSFSKIITYVMLCPVSCGCDVKTCGSRTTVFNPEEAFKTPKAKCSSQLLRYFSVGNKLQQQNSLYYYYSL